MFKPNLIHNFKDEEDPLVQIALRLKGKNLADYIISYKKDGCRLELLNGEVMTRSLKNVQNKHTVERFTGFARFLKKYGIILEGEFYDHDMSFEEIKRFFKTQDVTDPKHLKKFNKLEAEGRLDEHWPGRTPEWLTTNHNSLKMWVFDGYFIEFPDLTYEERMLSLKQLLMTDEAKPFWPLFKFEPSFTTPHGLETIEQLIDLYKEAISEDWEGLIVSSKARVYKMNRSTLNEGTFFKLKEDRINYIGEVISIVESTVAIPGAPKTTNELGRSVTSKLKEHRMPSGMAKGFVTVFDGEEHTVSLKGFDHAARKDLLLNSSKYVGRHFKYTGMKPTKVAPRQAQFNAWL